MVSVGAPDPFVASPAPKTEPPIPPITPPTATPKMNPINPPHPSYKSEIPFACKSLSPLMGLLSLTMNGPASPPITTPRIAPRMPPKQPPPMTFEDAAGKIFTPISGFASRFLQICNRRRICLSNHGVAFKNVSGPPHATEHDYQLQAPTGGHRHFAFATMPAYRYRPSACSAYRSV